MAMTRELNRILIQAHNQIQGTLALYPELIESRITPVLNKVLLQTRMYYNQDQTKILSEHKKVRYVKRNPYGQYTYCESEELATKFDYLEVI